MSAALKMTMAMVTKTERQCGLQAVPTLIVGLGQTGLSCARFLARCDVPFAVTDSREQPPAIDILRAEQKDIAISVGGFDAALFNWAQRLVVSPGVSLDEPLIVDARQRGLEIIGDIDLFARAAQAPIVAITGANGKSTVTLLLAGERPAQSSDVIKVGEAVNTGQKLSWNDQSGPSVVSSVTGTIKEVGSYMGDYGSKFISVTISVDKDDEPDGGFTELCRTPNLETAIDLSNQSTTSL